VAASFPRADEDEVLRFAKAVLTDLISLKVLVPASA